MCFRQPQPCVVDPQLLLLSPALPTLSLVETVEALFFLGAVWQVLKRNVEELKESSPDYVDAQDFEQRLDHYKSAYQSVEVRARQVLSSLFFW